MHCSACFQDKPNMLFSDTLGQELVQEFWLKSFSSLHERVRLQLKECLDSGFVPS